MLNFLYCFKCLYGTFTYINPDPGTKINGNQDPQGCLEVSKVINVQVGEPDVDDSVRAKDLVVAGGQEAHPVVSPGQVVDDVGGDSSLHDVKVIDVQQSEAHVYLKVRKFCSRVDVF